jgi:hypothetical protein
MHKGTHKRKAGGDKETDSRISSGLSPGCAEQHQISIRDSGEHTPLGLTVGALASAFLLSPGRPRPELLRIVVVHGARRAACSVTMVSSYEGTGLQFLAQLLPAWSVGWEELNRATYW